MVFCYRSFYRIVWISIFFKSHNARTDAKFEGQQDTMYYLQFSNSCLQGKLCKTVKVHSALYYTVVICFSVKGQTLQGSRNQGGPLAPPIIILALSA